MDTLESLPELLPDPVIQPKNDPYAALRSRDFRLLLIGRFIVTFGEQAVDIAIGWELYDRTHSALALGFVGLALVVPVLLLALPAGHLADRFDRKRIMLISQGVLAVGAVGLGLLSLFRGPVPLFYVSIFLMGVGSSFQSPSSSAFVTQTVPAEKFANAATWNSSSWQLASVLGPAFGGLIIALTFRATPVYFIYVAAVLVYICLLLAIRGSPRVVLAAKKGTTLASLREGIDFVWRTKVILAAITLDMFGVLLGGATTLLPVFARDILHVGPAGLGWLRAAPSLGAVVMALSLAHLPPMKRAGRALLLSVAGFGVATLIFGLSHSFVLSLIMLVLLGAFDNISVVVRSTLLLVKAPDAMRGRVSAVNSMFISTSNELGGFESGLTAALFGPVFSVAAGGIGTLIVVGAVALIWPQMRHLGKLSEES